MAALTQYTNKGEKLTLRESRFIDNVILTNNLGESYRKAYNKPPTEILPTDTEEIKKEKTRLSVKYMDTGKRIANKQKIAQEIKFRLDKRLEADIISVNEIYGYLSRVVRGEEKDQFGLDVSVSERTKAANELLKRLVDMPQKLEKSEPQEVKITLDWSNNKDDLEVIDAEINKKEDDSDSIKIGQINNQVGD